MARLAVALGLSFLRWVAVFASLELHQFVWEEIMARQPPATGPKVFDSLFREGNQRQPHAAPKKLW